MGWILVYFVTVAVPVPPTVTVPFTTYREEAKVMEFGFKTAGECLQVLQRVRQSKPAANCWEARDWAAQKRLNRYATVAPGENPVVAP